MRTEKIIILDFGGQYSQLIARRVRECGVYCEVLPFDAELTRIQSSDLKGIILSGAPDSVYTEFAFFCRLHFSAEQISHQLHPVADTQHRYP